MAEPVAVSFNMDPRWSEFEGLEPFLAPLRQAGLDTLEFELDSQLSNWSGFEPLMRSVDALGLGLCFHAPYRGANRIEGFAGPRREELIGLVGPMLSIAQGWAERKSRTMNVVIHGGVSKTATRAMLREDTLQFLDWALGSYSGIRIALENNHPAVNGEVKVGDTRLGVLDIVRELDHPRLGVCWDMGHDFLAGPQGEVEEEWLSRLVHIHVHDVDSAGVDHYPLVFDRVPYRIWLAMARRANFSGVVTLEIKGGQLAGWSGENIRSALVHSIQTVRQEMQ
jgi:sugar phosphate isomerase/epimerase